MTGADKFNKYYLVTAAEYEKRQLKPPPFTHKGIQNARIARAYEGVQDAQNNVTGKTIYQAMTELDREVDQLATRQPQYQDRNMRRSPDRRQEWEPRDRSMSISPVRQRRSPVRQEPRQRERSVSISPVRYHAIADYTPVVTPQRDLLGPLPLAQLRKATRTSRKRSSSPDTTYKDDELFAMFGEGDIIRPDDYNDKQKTKPLYAGDTHRVGPPSSAPKKKKKPTKRPGHQELNDILDTGRATRQTKSEKFRNAKIAADILERERTKTKPVRGRSRGAGRGSGQKRGTGSGVTGGWTPY